MEKYVLTIFSVVVFYAVIGMVYEQSTTTGMIIVHSPDNKLTQKGIIVHKPAETQGIIVHKPTDKKQLELRQHLEKTQQQHNQMTAIMKKRHEQSTKVLRDIS